MKLLGLSVDTVMEFAKGPTPGVCLADLKIVHQLAAVVQDVLAAIVRAGNGPRHAVREFSFADLQRMVEPGI